MKKLNVGCGVDIRKGWVNLDWIKQKGVDVVHDINVFPWPFKNSEFDEVDCQDVVEHCDDVLLVLKEIYRVVKRGGVVRMRVPHFTSSLAFGDPTHKHFFAWDTIDVVVKGSPYHFYVDFEFELVSRHLEFGKRFAFWNYVIELLANKFPKLYEDTPLRIFPALNLHIVLRKV